MSKLTERKHRRPRSSSQEKLVKLVSEIKESTAVQSEHVIKEIAAIQRDMHDIKQTLSRLQPVRQERRKLFGRRRSSLPVEVQPPPKKGMPLEELMPLLPQLGNALPQLKKNPKVADAVKVLSNPAVISMLQQFLANSGTKVKAVAYKGRRRF